MKLSALAAPLFATVGLASVFSFDKGSVGTVGEKIPGESPLELCDKEHGKDLLTITNVDLSPNPPLAGQELVIQADGFLSETVDDGAYVLLVVKYGLIRLVTTKADLCDQIENVDMECPIEKGKISISKVVELPREIPPGKYSVVADVYSAKDEPITCLQANVVFSRMLGVEL